MGPWPGWVVTVGGGACLPTERAAWTSRAGPGKIAPLSYRSRYPGWVRVVVGIVVLFIVLAVVGAALGH